MRADIHHKRTRIGYIAGAGDEVPAALRQAGYDVTMLTEETIAHGSLAPYQAIVTGVRAFNVDARLPFLHDRLMKYVADGGTMVVQYNTHNFISAVAGRRSGRRRSRSRTTRVTDETPRCTMLAPEHRHRATCPTSIGARDFAGWVQERGLYFADDWDTALHAHLRHARRRASRRARAGCSSRSTARARSSTPASRSSASCPAGVPGAYRLFANLLDYAP